MVQALKQLITENGIPGSDLTLPSIDLTLPSSLANPSSYHLSPSTSSFFFLLFLSSLATLHPRNKF